MSPTITGILWFLANCLSPYIHFYVHVIKTCTEYSPPGKAYASATKVLRSSKQKSREDTYTETLDPMDIRAYRRMKNAFVTYELHIISRMYQAWMFKIVCSGRVTQVLRDVRTLITDWHIILDKL